jgi:hypothetical protein
MALMPSEVTGVGGEVEADRDAEVAAAAAQRPEQVGVLHGVRADQPSVRGDHLRRGQAVDGQPVPADHPADAAAQRQPAHADLIGVSRGQPQPERAQGRGDRTPGRVEGADHQVGGAVGEQGRRGPGVAVVPGTSTSAIAPSAASADECSLLLDICVM